MHVRGRASFFGAVALVLALLVAGVPQAVLELAVGSVGCCSADCDESEDGHCPPTCSDGTCAKVASIPAVLVVERLRARPVERMARLRPGSDPHFRDAPNDVYHPPRA